MRDRRGVEDQGAVRRRRLRRARPAPAYLEVRLADLFARVERVPAREEVPVICEQQLVVGRYSR